MLSATFICALRTSTLELQLQMMINALMNDQFETLEQLIQFLEMDYDKLIEALIEEELTIPQSRALYRILLEANK